MTQNIQQHLDVAFRKALLDEGRCVERHVHLTSRYNFHQFRTFSRQHMATYEGITSDSKGLAL